MGDLERGQGQQQQQQSSSSGGWCSCVTNADFKDASSWLRLFNLVNAVLVVFAGIYTLIDIGGLVTLRWATIAISCYLFLFGCMLCCFELRISAIDNRVRQRFGFMYSYMGRTLFLFFIASFLFARNTTTTYAIGGITLANALMNCYVTIKHGEYSADPTAKYSTAEQTSAQYIRDNPELAQQAIGASVGYAQNNPDLVKASAQAGADYARRNPDQASQFANATYTQSQQTQGQGQSNPFAVSKN